MGWSDDDGEGTDVCAESGKAVGMDVEKLKSGVAIGSTGAGDENDEGVNACSVANRSGVGDEAGLKSPHPKTKKRVMVIQESLILFMICLN